MITRKSRTGAVADHRPAMRNVTRVHDAVATVELDGRATRQLHAQPSLDEMEHDVTGMVVPDVEVVVRRR